jgi:gliding motility-associated-like protein
MRSAWNKIWLMFVLTAFSMRSDATHIVGGEITYKCLGGNSYQIRLDIYQDCLGGEPQAIAQDEPAYIGIFDAGNPGQYYVIDSIGNTPSEISKLLVPPNFSNACVNNPPNTCLRRVSFVKNYFLPVNTVGYKVVYVRCCRNASINNILRPSETGATYFCNIPPVGEAACNNSAVFQNYPPQIICVGNPLIYDHSAKDDDGDSLSYEFCDAYPGGAPQDPKPKPSPNIPPPISVSNFGYAAGYSPQKPMAGNPIIRIDPVTGIISGTPNILGRFVVVVCCHEWRHGVLINTVTREFQFVVTNCSKAVVADIPQYSSEYNTYIVECKSKTVHFVNHSSGGFAYAWDFGIPGATSTDFEPTFSYPDTGTYMVKLVVNRGSTCPDSIARAVKVYPSYSANFSFDGLQCPHSEMHFSDLSDATYKPIVAWNWNFGDGDVSDVQNPVHAYNDGGIYDVGLVSTSIKGCVDTAVKKVDIEKFRPFAGNDTIIVKGEYVNFSATGGITYEWSPATMLNLTNVSNPIGYYPDTGHYAYNVHITSSYGCQGDDSVRVWVVGQSSLFVPSGFTPNGDGLNDVFRPMSVGYSQIKFFRVYDRWGELVFHTENISEGWDGTYKGHLCEVATYFWVLSIINRFGKEEMIKGDVTLIK